MSDEGGPRPEKPSVLERALGIITQVRPGEGLTVVMMAFNLFLVLCSYYMLKTIRESLILTEGGAALKTYSSAGQALLLLFLVPAFGAFASRVNRIQLLRGVTLFFVSNVVLFLILARAGVHVGIAFFVWVGIFNVMTVAQYWAFANDIYTPEQGKRLFAIVALGSNVGAWLGALWAGKLIGRLGPYPLMILAAVVLSSCVVMAELISRRQAAQARTKAEDEGKPLGKEGGFELIRKDRYLLLIAILIVVLNLVNTTGEYLLSKSVVAEATHRFGADEASVEARQKFIGGFYGGFFGWVNLTSFLLQMLAVSRIIRFVGVGGALFVHPTLVLLGYLSMVRFPTLGVVSLVKGVDNTVDYSLGKTAQQALWLPTSREAKYKAKQAVDAFFMRAGDVLSAGLVFLGERLALALPAFAAINVVLAVVWMLILARLAPENGRRMSAAGQPA